jgi:hypothetical protein
MPGQGGAPLTLTLRFTSYFVSWRGGHAWTCSRLYRAVGTTRNLFSPAAAAFRMLHGATIGSGIAVGYMRDFSRLQSCIGSIPGFTKLYQATFDKCQCICHISCSCDVLNASTLVPPSRSVPWTSWPNSGWSERYPPTLCACPDSHGNYLLTNLSPPPPHTHTHTHTVLSSPYRASL